VIFEAIAAIKIANECISAIKEFAGHCQSVGEMGKDLSKLADAKEEIEKKAKDGDMEAFFALEDIKRREVEIKNMFVYQGRPGLWDDYQTFMRNRKELKRKEIEREKAKKLARAKAIKNGLIITGAVLGVFTAVGIAAYMVYWMVSLKGR
jgi:predicted ATP-dependent protease